MRIKDDKVYEVSVYRPDADWWDAHRLGVATVRGARNLTDLFFKARKRIGGCNGEDTKAFYIQVVDVEESTIDRYVFRNKGARIVKLK